MSRRATSTLGVIGVIAAIGLVLAGSEYILGLLSSSVRINSSGVVTSVNLEVYWDSACTNRVTAIDWGTISPGETKPIYIYVKNTGNVPITLSLSTDAWSPAEASNYLTLTWDYKSGTEIQPNGVLKVTLTLTVSSSTQGITNFSFNIIIVGTQK